MSVLVSIVLTTYNASKTIHETLEAINSQTYHNYEVVVIDDGSSDTTVDMIHAYVGNNERYRVYKLERIGRAKALMKACELAIGKYIAIIDADDIWHSQKLEIQMKVISENKIAFLCTKSNIFVDLQELQNQLKIDFATMQYLPSRISQHNVLTNNPIAHSSVLMKKELAHYDDTRKKIIDYDLWLRLVQHTELYILPQALTFHRIHNLQNFESSGMTYSLTSVFLRLKHSFKQRQLRAIFINILITFGYILGFSYILRISKTQPQLKKLHYFFDKMRV